MLYPDRDRSNTMTMDPKEAVAQCLDKYAGDPDGFLSALKEKGFEIRPVSGKSDDAKPAPAKEDDEPLSAVALRMKGARKAMELTKNG